MKRIIIKIVIRIVTVASFLVNGLTTAHDVAVKLNSPAVGCSFTGEKLPALD
jgi:hypothetical protein